MQTLGAVDLAAPHYARIPWRELRTTSSSLATFDLGLPTGGRASPIGYWFSPVDTFLQGAATHRIEIRPLGDEPSVEDRRPMRTARLFFRPPSNSEIVSEVLIEVSRDTARIRLDESAWAVGGEALLLAVSQCWRFAWIDAQLGGVTNWLRANHARLDGLRPCGRALRQALAGHERGFRALILDLPGYEDPLTDPAGYFESPQSARLYRLVCKKLGLHGWRARVDERVEVIEAILADIVGRRHQIDLTWVQLVLEVLILAALASDLVLLALDHLRGS
jgi:hypothetical protein